MKEKKDYRIVYMGTPSLSAKTLDALINEGFNVVALIAQEDKEIGRKKKIEAVPTKVIANKYNIPVYQPRKIREDYEFVKKLKPDLILSFAYGQIVPQGLLDIPTLGALNLHGSILPKYRGAAPIQRAIMNGEIKSGVTLMQMIDKMDAGKMYATVTFDIFGEDNYTSVCDKISNAANEVIKEYLLKYLEGKLEGVSQNEEEVTFANKISPEEEKIDIATSAVEQINKIRALSYIPGAYLMLDNEKLKIFKAKIYEEKIIDEVGKLSIDNKHLLYQAKDALIELLEIQSQGKNKMAAIDFYNGHKAIIGKYLK